MVAYLSKIEYMCRNDSAKLGRFLEYIYTSEIDQIL
jgi:hypothetical protein